MDATSQSSWPRWAGGSRDAGWHSSYDLGDRRQPKPKKPEKDLTQKLMEKGFVPLAAFDVTRDWMLLEMMALTDMEKNMEFEIEKSLGDPQIVRGNALLPTLHQLVDFVDNLLADFLPLLE